ncbi:MAG: hypothetical protein J6U84_01490 [Bacteroidales bacterium]|jgi:hypothetical protein|nr:hypothetical protein [Bacteroidales bacterium]
MKRIFLTLGLVSACVILTSCTETTDCECIYGNEVYQYYDWSGSCSDIMLDAKKAEFGNLPIVCTEIY